MEADELAVTEELLRSVPDKDFQAEADRRDRARRKAYEQEQFERYQRERQAEEQRDREFAASIGITYEQYEQAEDHAREKFYDYL